MAKPKLCVNCAADMPEEFCLWDGCTLEEEAEEAITLSLGNSLDEPTEKVMLDPVSTGRKRAAVMYKIEGGQVCDWAWRKNCGGGVAPIYGCTGRPASHIHHGPCKSTLNNVKSNISLVCEFCHNRWHVANDKYYGKRPVDNGPWMPNVNIEGKTILTLSDIQKATKQEILMQEMLQPEGGKDAK